MCVLGRKTSLDDDTVLTRQKISPSDTEMYVENCWREQMDRRFLGGRSPTQLGPLQQENQGGLKDKHLLVTLLRSPSSRRRQIWCLGRPHVAERGRRFLPDPIPRTPVIT